MFRRAATVATVSTAATSVRMASVAPGTVGHFGFMTPKFDFHADVCTKYVAKGTFNPYAPGFMESLEKRSLAAQPAVSNVDNQFKFMQHTGSYVIASF